jgi:uncharacterized protein involved in type VI secretion and phage assembly
MFPDEPETGHKRPQNDIGKTDGQNQGADERAATTHMMKSLRRAKIVLRAESSDRRLAPHARFVRLQSSHAIEKGCSFALPLESVETRLDYPAAGVVLPGLPRPPVRLLTR